MKDQKTKLVRKEKGGCCCSGGAPIDQCDFAQRPLVQPETDPVGDATKR